MKTNRRLITKNTTVDRKSAVVEYDGQFGARIRVMVRLDYGDESPDLIMSAADSALGELVDRMRS